MPPTSGATRLATPCAISSAFELCRSPVIESATTAESRLSTAASSATVSADGSSGRIRSARNAGTCDRRQAAGDAAEPRADRLHRQVEQRHGGRAGDQRHDRAGHARQPARHQQRRAPASRRPAPAAAGLNVGRRCAERRHAREELARRVARCRSPRKSLICVEAISSAMPLVKPRTTGRGMNFTAWPRPVTARHEQDHAGHHRHHQQARTGRARR